MNNSTPATPASVVDPMDTNAPGTSLDAALRHAAAGVPRGDTNAFNQRALEALTQTAGHFWKRWNTLPAAPVVQKEVL